VRSTLDEVAGELEEMRSLVASISPVNAVLSNYHDSVVRKYLVVRRRFDYAAFVVALYASLEKFLENLVGEYARLVALRAQYSELPDKLVQKHMNKSAELLARGRLGEGRYLGIREVDVVKNLYDCLTGATPYRLNRMAVVAHDLNLRPFEINALFNAVGIEQVCELVRRTDAMLEWYAAFHAPSSPPQSGVPIAMIEQRINDVVERRNQVAHRGGNPLELLGPDEMSDMVAFIEALCRSIFSIVVAEYLQRFHVAGGDALALRLREGPYKDGRVVVVDRPTQRLFVGQPIFVFAPRGARWGRILTLQINEQAVDIVGEVVTGTDVGIGLDFKCPKDATLYALESDDDAVWSTGLSH
jgi:hypothetical protein